TYRAHSARESAAGADGLACLSAAALWRQPCLWQSADRLRHRGVGDAYDARRPGALPPDLVQAESRDARRRGRHPAGRDPADADELAKAQANLTLTLPGNWETMDAVQGSLEQLVTYGLDDHYYETYAQRVRALTIPDATTAAQDAIRPDHLVWVVVGDRSKIEAGIRELNFGEIRFLDADGKPLASRE